MKYAWCSTDGREIEISSHAVRIGIADRMWMRTSCDTSKCGHPSLELPLLEETPDDEVLPTARGRFVIIPLDEFSLLVAVAEASDSPVELMPYPSTPVWIGPDGGPMPTREGFLVARAPDGTALSLTLVPGPRARAGACVLRISSVSEGWQCETGEVSRALSICKIAPGIVQITLGQFSSEWL